VKILFSILILNEGKKMKDTRRRSRLDSFFPAFLGLMLIILPGRSMADFVLDPEFGDGGIKVDEIGNLNDRAHAAVLQKDGKIVVAGTSDSDPTVKVAVLRYNGNGSLDTSFNIDGKAVFVLGSGDDGANDVAVRENGTIVVAGYLRETVDGDKQFALLQITPAGIPDLEFGGSASGIVTLPAGENSGEAMAVILDSENRIVVGGVVQSETKKWAVAARYLEDGTLDPSFGDGGLRRIETDDDTTADFIALQSDGKIVLGGMKESKSQATAVVFRLDENGSIDMSYGDNGEAVISDPATDSRFFSAVLLDDDSLVAAGYTTTDGRQNITTAKFSSAGQLDATYGNDGTAVNELEDDESQYNGIAYSITTTKNGTFVVAGEAENGSNNSDIVLIHLDAAGAIEKSTVIKEAGETDRSEVLDAGDEPLQEYELIVATEEGEPVLTDINGENDGGRAVVVSEDGRVLVAGFSSDGVNEDMALVAFAGDDHPTETPGEDSTPIEDIPYLIATIPPNNVTRNGAMSGGVITENDLFECPADVECLPTVTARGVVFGVTPFPSFRVTEEDTETPENGETEEGSVFPKWVANSSNNFNVVRRGQTSDGSGKGTYGSDITAVTPDVLYYVRAYAVLSDETIIYGNQKSFKTEDACFIATAAFGSPLQSHVSVLRQFRDRYLKTHEAGRSFVGMYYHFSPELADFIGRSSLLRLAVKIALLPLVAFGYFMVYFSLQMKVIFLLLLGCAFYSTQFMLSRR
jgi:uncharacterized delta-60 repeat protein